MENNGGSASIDYNCTTLIPLWKELKKSLKDGCERLIDSPDSFPCEQVVPCQ